MWCCVLVPLTLRSQDLGRLNSWRPPGGRARKRTGLVESCPRLPSAPSFIAGDSRVDRGRGQNVGSFLKGRGEGRCSFEYVAPKAEAWYVRLPQLLALSHCSGTPRPLDWGRRRPKARRQVVVELRSHPAPPPSRTVPSLGGASLKRFRPVPRPPPPSPGSAPSRRLCSPARPSALGTCLFLEGVCGHILGPFPFPPATFPT